MRCTTTLEDRVKEAEYATTNLKKKTYISESIFVDNLDHIFTAKYSERWNILTNQYIFYIKITY